jgi:hypothetical protein
VPRSKRRLAEGSNQRGRKPLRQRIAQLRLLTGYCGIASRHAGIELAFGSLPLLRALPHDDECATAHTEFPEDVMQMLLDRPFRDTESVRNLAVGHSLHQQIDDLPLAARE